MEKHQTPDIFLWANRVDQIKDSLDVELFLFTKGNTPYHLSRGSSITSAILPFFLYDLISEVQTGAATGLSLRDYDNYDSEAHTLLHTPLEDVALASDLIYQIEEFRDSIDEFAEDEHDFRRVKGLVARFTHKDDPTLTFHVVKTIKRGSVLRGATAWELKGGRAEQLTTNIAFSVPTDNQVLIVAGEIFAFSPDKFEAMFNYQYRRFALADQKIKEIEKLYTLRFPDGVTLTSLVHDRKQALTKLLKMEIGGVTQKQAIEYADEIGLELLTDNGAIIILDGTDLDVFLNLINEDYATNDITGRRYEIKNKKAMEVANVE